MGVGNSRMLEQVDVEEDAFLKLLSRIGELEAGCMEAQKRSKSRVSRTSSTISILRKRQGR